MSSREKRVLQNVRRFEQLEKDFLKFTYETSKPSNGDEIGTFLGEALRIATEAFTVKNEILDDFHDVTELRIHDRHALRLLDSIRHGDKFYSVAFYETMAEMINAGNDNVFVPTSLHDVLELKLHELFSDFDSWFDLIGYYFNKIRIGPIISSSKVPDRLLAYFDELRETFAFGQYRSSIVLCRALLEMALYEKLKAKGAFKNKDPKVIQIDVAKEDNLNRYINMAKWEHVMQTGSCDMAHEVRKTANAVLHAKDSEKALNPKDAMEVIFKTLKIIEHLYR